MMYAGYFNEVYFNLLSDLSSNYEYQTKPRNLLINEITNVHLSIFEPKRCIIENTSFATVKNYLAGELLWYLSGRNDIEWISKYSKFWNNIVNPDGKTLNSAYGKLLWGTKNTNGETEWEWAKRSLISDKDTRQAIIRFNKPEHSFEGNKDFVCTLNGIFQIRSNELKLTIIMRSSDAVLGLRNDVPFFGLLLYAMKYELRESYPDLKIGTLDMFLSSSHIYENKFNQVKDIISLPYNNFTCAELPEYDNDLIGKDVDTILNSNGKLAEWIKENNFKENV